MRQAKLDKYQNKFQHNPMKKSQKKQKKKDILEGKISY